MRILAIVIIYNGERWVETCFGSLTESEIKIDILAVDNCSTDKSISIVKDRFPGVQIKQTPKNLGFGQANNLGFKKAIAEEYDYVFLLNQDAWIEKNTISQLLQVGIARPEYGIISPFHLLPGKGELEWHFSQYISPPYCKDLYSDMFIGNMKDIYELPFVNAAAWFLSVKCVKDVGGFDPLFFQYGEDEDYCTRVKMREYKIGVTPRARIIHDITLQSWEKIKANKNRQLIFSVIELKNVQRSYLFNIITFVKTRLGRGIDLLLARRWKEWWFMTKIFFASLALLGKIKRSRSISKQHSAFLK